MPHTGKHLCFRFSLNCSQGCVDKDKEVELRLKRKKKAVSFLLAFALLFSMAAVPAQAVVGYIPQEAVVYPLAGGTLYLFEEEDHMTLFNSENLKGDVVLPDVIYGKPLTELLYDYGPREGNRYFCLSNNPKMTSLTLPSTLEKLTFDENNAELPYGSFFGWPNGGRREEGSCNLKEIIFTGENVTALPDRCFQECYSVERIVLPKSLREMSGAAFQTMYFRKDLDSFGRFETESSSLREIVIDPENPYFTVDEQGIVYNKAKTRVITAVAKRPGRTEVTLPDTVTTIEDYAFEADVDLQRLYGKNVRQVGENTFHLSGQLNPFADTYGHWAEDACAWAFQEGIFRGATPTSMNPDETITRGMFITALFRYAVPNGVYNDYLKPFPFTDVESGAYYRRPVCWAYEFHLVKGISPTLFGPNQQITREQIATLLYRLAQGEIQGEQELNLLTAFSDGNSVSAYAREAIAWAVGAGIFPPRFPPLRPRL